MCRCTCACGDQKKALGSTSSTMCSKNQTCFIRFIGHMVLPSEPCCWPSDSHFIYIYIFPQIILIQVDFSLHLRKTLS